MTIKIELESAPSMLSLYRRVLTSRKSGVLGDTEMPMGEAVLHGVQCDPAQLRDYRRVCGFADSNFLPVTFPFVLATPLQLSLLVSDAFPFSPLGIVHVSNRIEQYRPIAASETLNFSCVLSGPRAAQRGREFDLHTRVMVGDELVWECTATMLRREKTKARNSNDRRARTPEEFSAQACEPLEIAADIGRRYARVSGDGNPIHLYALSAKLFGFPRAIAHGMWSKARCLAALESLGKVAHSTNGRFAVEVQFNRPLLIPAKAQFECAANGDFRITTADGKRLHLQGQLQ